MSKKKNFHADKWYIHKPESAQENERYKILRDLEIQTDPRVLARISVVV